MWNESNVKKADQRLEIRRPNRPLVEHPTIPSSSKHRPFIRLFPRREKRLSISRILHWWSIVVDVAEKSSNVIA